jgi:LytS/YehU family sensor histidine kinase
MIVGLSEFFRRTSRDFHRPEVPLAKEVEYLQRYIEIQKVRYEDRLRVSVEVPEDLLDAQVPSLLLQPLVENAIKHGVANRIAGGAIRVSATRHEKQLRLSVYNDGDLADASDEGEGAGVGLVNLRTRLAILHGTGAGLRLDRAGSDGVEVVVTLPLRVA